MVIDIRTLHYYVGRQCLRIRSSLQNEIAPSRALAAIESGSLMADMDYAELNVCAYEYTCKCYTLNGFRVSSRKI